MDPPLEASTCCSAKASIELARITYVFSGTIVSKLSILPLVDPGTIPIRPFILDNGDLSALLSFFISPVLAGNGG